MCIVDLHWQEQGRSRRPISKFQLSRVTMIHLFIFLSNIFVNESRFLVDGNLNSCIRRRSYFSVGNRIFFKWQPIFCGNTRFLSRPLSDPPGVAKTAWPYWT